MADNSAGPSLQHLASLTSRSYLCAMTNSAPNPILDRLFRHMAWANQYLFERLQRIPSEALALTTENKEYSVEVIAEHYVRSAGFYIFRVTGIPLPADYEIITSKDDLSGLAKRCAAFDEQLRELAMMPEAMTTYRREGKTIIRARSTILGQSIYHATEHRAQIAGLLYYHGITAIDLDEMDIWAYSDAEGLGA